MLHFVKTTIADPIAGCAAKVTGNGGPYPISAAFRAASFCLIITF
jgi:hypothetical protein